MDKQTFYEEALRLAREAGCEAAEIYAARSDSFSVNVLDGTFDRYESSATGGMSLRVKMDGRDGYAYTEAYEEPEELVRRAMDNASVLSPEEHPMQTAQAYRAVIPREDPIAALSPEERIALALRMESAAKAQDPRVIRLDECEVGTAESETEIRNTLGLRAERKDRLGYCFCSAILQDGEEVRTDYAFRTGAEAADAEACAREAVEKAAARFGASPVPSGNWRIVLAGEAAAALLRGFSPAFSAEQVQKGLSFLKGMEGERIASGSVTIRDDPTHPIGDVAFDGEGTPTFVKSVVENGTLVTLLHNLKTAAKAGCTSTGNASRASAAAPVGIAPSVFYVVPGTASREELLDRMGDGLLITDLEGLHSGLNPITGDFSLKAVGSLIEGGKRIRAVSGITVGGSFRELLKKISLVGSDLVFGLPGASVFGSPSLLIDGITVGGL